MRNSVRRKLLANGFRKCRIRRSREVDRRWTSRLQVHRCILPGRCTFSRFPTAYATPPTSRSDLPLPAIWRSWKSMWAELSRGSHRGGDGDARPSAIVADFSLIQLFLFPLSVPEIRCKKKKIEKEIDGLSRHAWCPFCLRHHNAGPSYPHFFGNCGIKKKKEISSAISYNDKQRRTHSSAHRRSIEIISCKLHEIDCESNDEFFMRHNLPSLLPSSSINCINNCEKHAAVLCLSSLGTSCEIDVAR